MGTTLDCFETSFMQANPSKFKLLGLHETLTVQIIKLSHLSNCPYIEIVPLLVIVTSGIDIDSKQWIDFSTIYRLY